MPEWLLRLHRPFRLSPARPPGSFAPEARDRRYRRLRWTVFLSVTIAYGLFYVGRINFSVAKKPMLDEGVLTATEMGLIGSALLIAYAAGKFLNGLLADRSHVGRFLSAGLLAIALVHAILGFDPGFGLFVALWGLNGWFQSVGAPSSIVALSRWFSPNERGTRYGVWCTSHNLGEVITFLMTAALVSWGGWRLGFLGPAVVCGIGGLLLLRLPPDRPEANGLPPVTLWRDDPAPTDTPGAPVGRLQAEVYRNPAVWILGIASALMYVSRHDVNHGAPLLLQDGKGHSTLEAGTVMGIYSFAGLAGSFLSGIPSDRFFGARRHVLNLMAAVVQIAAPVALAAIPPGHRGSAVWPLTIWGTLRRGASGGPWHPVTAGASGRSGSNRRG